MLTQTRTYANEDIFFIGDYHSKFTTSTLASQGVGLVESCKNALDETDYSEVATLMHKIGNMIKSTNVNKDIMIFFINTASELLTQSIPKRLLINSLWFLTQAFIHCNNIFMDTVSMESLIVTLLSIEETDSGVKRSLIILISNLVTKKEAIQAIIESINPEVLIQFLTNYENLEELNQFLRNLFRIGLNEELFSVILDWMQNHVEFDVIVDCLSISAKFIDNLTSFLEEHGIIKSAKDTLEVCSSKTVSSCFRILGIGQSMKISDFNIGTSKNMNDNTVLTGVWALINSSNIGDEEIISEFMINIVQTIILNESRSYKCRQMSAFLVSKYIYYCGESTQDVLKILAQFANSEPSNAEITASILNSIVECELCEEMFEFLGESIEDILAASENQNLSEAASRYIEQLEKND